MSFSDSDLQRLKASLHLGGLGITLLELKALLARLEAAEAVCLIAGQSFMPIDKAEAIELTLIAWRKAKGESHASDESAGKL